MLSGINRRTRSSVRPTTGPELLSLVRFRFSSRSLNTTAKLTGTAAALLRFPHPQAVSLFPSNGHFGGVDKTPSARTE